MITTTGLVLLLLLQLHQWRNFKLQNVSGHRCIAPFTASCHGRHQ